MTRAGASHHARRWSARPGAWLSIVAACLAPVAGPAYAWPAPPTLAEAARSLDAVAAEGLDRAVLVGLAGDDESERVRRVSRDVLAAPADAADSDGAAVVRGRAHLLLAALEPDPRRRAAELARAADHLRSVRLARTAPEALRRVSLAQALPMAGDTPEPDDPSPAELIESVLDFPIGPDPARQVPRAIVLEALAVRLRAADPASAPNARRDLVSAVGADPDEAAFPEEVEARRGLDRAGASPGAEVVDRLLSPLGERARRWAESSASGASSRAATVRERVRAAVARTGVPPAELSPSVALAWASADLAHRPGNEPARAVLGRLASAQPGSAEALWVLAADATRRGETIESARCLLELASRFPEDRRAPEALRAAERQADAGPDERLAREIYRQRRGTAEQGRAAERLAGAIMAGAERDGFARLGEALDLLDDARSSAAAQDDSARVLEAQRALADRFAAWAVIQERPVAASIDTALRIESWATRADPGRAPAAAVLAGELLARVPDRASEARAAYERALASADERARHGAIDGLARWARSGEGPARERRSDETFATLRRVVDEADAASASRPGARDGTYWHAWAEMLAIMADRNARGERSAQIRLRIRQLELIDSSLGAAHGKGEWSRRIRAIEAGL